MQNNNQLPPGYSKIKLSGKNGSGKFVLVDIDDYDYLSSFKWFLVKGYAKRVEHYTNKEGKRTTRLIAMHRVITNAPENLVVDHRNHNKLDNRKSNLRICTCHENNLNNKARGYCWDNTSKRWRVTIKEDGKYRYRSFLTEEEAKRAAKMVKSGNVPVKKYKERNKYMPKYISKNRLSGFYFRCIINGVKYAKYGFKNIAEAKIYRDNFFLENNINILGKENI